MWTGAAQGRYSARSIAKRCIDLCADTIHCRTAANSIHVDAEESDMCARYYLDDGTEAAIQRIAESVGGRRGIPFIPGEYQAAAETADDRRGRPAPAREAAAERGSRTSKTRAEGGKGRQQAAAGEDSTVDIHPSETATVLSERDHMVKVSSMRWGFPFAKQEHPGQEKEVFKMQAAGRKGKNAAGTGSLLINARAETALAKPMFSESVMRRRCVIPAAGFYEWDTDRNKAAFFLPDSPCLFMAGFYNLFAGENCFIILTTEANAGMRSVHDRMPLILPEEDVIPWIQEADRTAEYLRRRSPELIRKQDYEQLTLPLW